VPVFLYHREDFREERPDDLDLVEDFFLPLLEADFFLPVEEDDLDLEAVFFLPLDADFFFGTFAPFSRASLKPIAIACFRLLTLPPVPLFNVPFFLRCIADST
jgi:hypothetical protein